MGKTKGFYCSSCGQWHEDLPFDYGADVPDMVYDIPKLEREKRVYATSDYCVIDGQHYFVRAVIEIPVLDSEQSFCWGVWVSLSEKNFEHSIEMFQTVGRESEPPCFGWLCTALPYAESSMHLKTMVYTQPVGERPKVVLEPTQHPLALEQRKGITLQRVEEIAEKMMHGTQ